MLHTKNLHIKYGFTYKWVCKRNFFTDEIKGILDNPDVFFKTDRKNYLQVGKTADVITVNHNGSLLVIKRFRTLDFFQMLRRALWISRAKRNWYNAIRLKKWGINTPEPVAYIEKRYIFIKHRAFFISQFVDSEQLLTALKHKDDKAQIFIIDQVINILLTLKKHCFFHGDLHHNNFLVDKDNNVYLLDLDVMRRVYKRKNKKFSQDRDHLFSGKRPSKALLLLIQERYKLALEKSDSSLENS